jgi:hypothetical protein
LEAVHAGGLRKIGRARRYINWSCDFDDSEGAAAEQDFHDQVVSLLGSIVDSFHYCEDDDRYFLPDREDVDLPRQLNVLIAEAIELLDENVDGEDEEEEEDS